ncbi:hypothetical protein JCM16496A_11900 [Bacteroides rodentium JCM 16496]
MKNLQGNSITFDIFLIAKQYEVGFFTESRLFSYINTEKVGKMSGLIVGYKSSNYLLINNIQKPLKSAFSH